MAMCWGSGNMCLPWAMLAPPAFLELDQILKAAVPGVQLVARCVVSATPSFNGTPGPIPTPVSSTLASYLVTVRLGEMLQIAPANKAAVKGVRLWREV
jgi:hypothetical protein